MFKRCISILITFVFMISIVACSSEEKSISIDTKSGVSVLTDFLNAYKKQDIEKILSISMDRSFDKIEDYKEHVIKSLKDPEQRIKDFEVLDKSELNSNYLALYAKINFEKGDTQEVKFKIMPKDDKLIVYLKELEDGGTRVENN